MTDVWSMGLIVVEVLRVHNSYHHMKHHGTDGLEHIGGRRLSGWKEPGDRSSIILPFDQDHHDLTDAFAAGAIPARPKKLNKHEATLWRLLEDLCFQHSPGARGTAGDFVDSMLDVQESYNKASIFRNRSSSKITKKDSVRSALSFGNRSFKGGPLPRASSAHALSPHQLKDGRDAVFTFDSSAAVGDGIPQMPRQPASLPLSPLLHATPPDHSHIKPLPKAGRSKSIKLTRKVEKWLAETQSYNNSSDEDAVAGVHGGFQRFDTFTTERDIELSRGHAHFGSARFHTTNDAVAAVQVSTKGSQGSRRTGSSDNKATTVGASASTGSAAERRGSIRRDSVFNVESSC